MQDVLMEYSRGLPDHRPPEMHSTSLGSIITATFGLLTNEWIPPFNIDLEVENFATLQVGFTTLALGGFVWRSLIRTRRISETVHKHNTKLSEKENEV